MADEQIVTSIVAKADLSSLVSQVHKVTTSLQQLQRELIASNKSIAASTKVANNAFRDTLVQSGLFSSHFINLNSDVNKFGKNLDGGRLKLKDYFSTFQSHLKTSKGLIRELAKEQVMLQNAVLQPLGRNAQGLMQFNVAVPRGLDLVKNKSQLARMELQIMNRALLEGSTQLINWGKNTQWAGRQLTVGLTVPLTMFGAAAAKAFREADQELTRLVKVYGDLAGTSSAELAKIRKDVTETAKELSSAMGVSFKETLALAADVAATGKTGQDLIASVKETTRLAVLGEVDRQEAMKATLAIQTAFKANTEELTESINFLNAVENQTSTTLNDLVEAIPKAGTVVKQLGGSVEDLALYLTAMREGGVNASEAANALKSGLASMINPTKQTIGVMSDFGIDIMGMVAQNTGNTTGMILSLQKALDTLDPLSKARALEQMFGKFQFARMAALFNNLGKSGSQTLQVMELMNASASELAGVAGRELALVTESASGKFKRAVESLKASLSGVGEDFLNFGTKVLNIFEKIVNFFTNLPGPVKKLITLFGGITAIAGPLIMITGVLANFMGYITKGIVLMKSFFQGTGGWKLLTPEMIAAERAARMVEKSFYSDAAAANVLHTALQKLIFDYASLKTSMAAGVIPVNPTISTVGGTFLSGTRRIVDPTSPYVGEPNTRAMSHINPRDPDNPASLMGVVPGAIPVNRNIGKTPQIYMQDRLPNIEGLTSVKGISTGINADEAARFHALMATLGMQTDAEVESLKKTIALGGTVSKELLDTFDDVLPITARIADGAATQSAAIVAELRAGTITVEQAKARIIALNAQIEAMLRNEISLYAASKGRTIDFTKAPLMDQPVVDANGQFTLRDLYKKENNRAVLEEIGRLRGIRTFGAPYSTQTTKFPRMQKGGPIRGYKNGGDIERFGPSKTVVSGPSSINYDDRMAELPLDGYVVNQPAAMNPANKWIHEIAPYTYDESGPTVTAAVTPKELVLGRGLRKDPLLYAMVDAANNGYNFGGGIINSIMKGYGRAIPTDELRELYSKIFMVEKRILSSPNWEEEVKLRHVMHDAAILHSHAGLSEKDAIEKATKFWDETWEKTFDKKTGLIDPRAWRRERIKGALKLNSFLNALIKKGTTGIKNLETYKGEGQSARFRPTSELIGEFREAARAGKFGGVKLFDHVIDSLYPRGFDISQTKGNEFLPVSEHSQREGLWRTPDGKLFQLAGNLGMGMMGEREINAATNEIHRITGGARPDQIPLTNAAVASDRRQQQRRNVNFTSSSMNSSTRNWLIRAIMRQLDSRSFFMPNAARMSYSGGKNSGGPILGYNKGGGVVRKGRHTYGEKFRTRYDSMTGKHIVIDVPDGFPPSYLGQSVTPAELDQLRMQASTKYPAAATGPSRGIGHGGLMVGSMIGSMAAYSIGTSLSGGNQYVGFGAAMAAEIGSYALLNKMINKTGDAAQDAAKKGSLMERAFKLAARAPGWARLAALVIGVGLAVKKVNDAINNHRRTVSLAFGPSTEIIEKLNLKFTTLNDQLEAAQARMESFRESGGALYASYTSAGIPGITLSIKQLKELKEKVTQDFPELIQMFDQAAGSEVTAKAESLKAQFVAGGMEVQEATNLVYALISASNKATFALRAIASEGFRSIKDEASAAASSIKTFFTLLNSGNTDQLVAAFDTVLNSLQAAEQKLIGLDIDGYGIVDAAEAYEITLKRINETQGANKQLTGDQLEALKEQNPLLYTILGTSETLASVFAKIRMYAMGITLDFTKLDPKVAQNLSTAIMQMDTFYRTSTDKDNPFASLVTEINKAKEQSQAADEQTIKNAQQKKEDLEDLIELKQKEIDAIREEADERRKALEEQQQDEDVLLQIRKKQLEYNNAMASGDVVTAAQAQLDIQRLVGQQQMDLAKRAIDEKEKQDVDAKEAEIESLRNRIKGLEDTVEAAQETAKSGAEDLAKLQDLLGRGIQAIMMGQGGYSDWEKGTVQQLIEDLKKETDPAIKSIVPLLEEQLKNPDKTKFEKDLVTTLSNLDVTLQEIRDKYLKPINTDMNNEPKTKNFWEKAWDLFKRSVTLSWGSPGFGFSEGGYIKGPGTGTSDSIPGYITGFADGGAVPIRVSNTEYITRANSVKDITVPNMDLINERGAEGVVMAAQNILGVNAATGGYVNKLVNYAMGSTGGLPKISPQKKFNFNKLDDRMTYAMKHLISKGMTAEAAAGIVGNLIAESTLRTGAMEAGHTREGRGIAQWGVNARWKTYQNWLKKNGRKDIYDLANQLDFIWWEMHNGQLADPNKFKTLTNISRAAYLFMDQYERPGVLRWKERNTWAYKAYKQYTGKDYVDVASTLYPGPDKAKSDYDKGLSSPSSEMLPEDPEKFISPMIIPGVSKVSALGFARGGYLGFKNGSQKGLNISKGKYNKLKDYFSQFGDMSVNFQTDKHDLYPSEIQELREIAQKIMGSKPRPSSMNVVGYADQRGSTKYNMALSRRRAKYVAQILSYLAPGIDFNPIALGEESGKYSQLAMSKKRRVSIELPPRVGGGLSLPYEPKGMGGSSPFEGIFPGGGFQGLMTLAKGGYLGFKDGGAPHEMGMRGTPKKQNWFQRYVSRLTESQDQTQSILRNNKLTSWMSADPLGTHEILRKFAGQGRKGDNPALAAALLPLNFMGSGAGTSFGKLFRNISSVVKYKAHDITSRAKNSFTMLKGMLKPSIQPTAIPIYDRSVLFPNLTHKLVQSGVLSPSPTVRSYGNLMNDLERAARFIATKKAPEALGMRDDAIGGLPLLPMVFPGRGAVSVYTSPMLGVMRESFGTPALRQTFKNMFQQVGFKKKPKFVEKPPSEWSIEDSNIIEKYVTNFMPNFKPLVGYVKGLVERANSYNFYRKYPNADNPAFARGENVYMPMKLTKAGGHKHGTPDTLIHELGHRDEHVFGDLKNVPGYVQGARSGAAEIYADAFAHRAHIMLRQMFGSKYGTYRTEMGGAYGLPTGLFSGLGTPEFRETVFESIKDNILRQTSGGHNRSHQFNSTWFESHAKGFKELIGDMPQVDALKLKSTLFKSVGLIHGTEKDYAERLARLAELLKIDIPGKSMGGYMGQIRKFHDWNGPIPGAYGSEVAAVLQAGREGVYDTDYVSALKNGTMNPTTGNSKVINVGSVQMTFTEPVTNGKQIFNEFKALLSFENNASNSNMNLGVGA